MGALDDARAVLARSYSHTTARSAWASHRAALAALVADCESERAQLGELLVRAVEAFPVWLTVGETSLVTAEALVEGADDERVVREKGPTLPDALRALLAKVERNETAQIVFGRGEP